MPATHQIVRFLDDFLDAPAFADYGPNGLQVPGRTEVDRVVTGVSASLELFERAAAVGAGLVLVHHGVFWDGAPRALTPAAAARLRVLLDAEINLVAYHLPLDAHREAGIHFIAAGHYATETFGVRRLGELVAEHFGVEHEFVDLPNPV